MSVLRVLRQLSVTSNRALAARPASSLARQGLHSLIARAVSAHSTRAFSVTACRLGEGTSDVALSQKLAEELQYEKTTETSSGDPDFLQAFKQQGIWNIEDALGSDEVTLTRKFGNETIRLMFSIADMVTGEEDEEGFGQTEEREDGDTAAEESEESFPEYPIRASFSITKSSGPGALNVDTLCQHGSFMVENMSFYRDAGLGTELTAEADWKRRGLYIGPQFESLDVTVQEEVEKFLRERGIDEQLAVFIPEYAGYKEQKEYVRWLENVKKFIDL